MMLQENLTAAERVAVHKETTQAFAARQHGPKMQGVRVSDGHLVLTLSGGAVEGTTISIPIENIPIVRDISAEELPNVRLMGGGSAIVWPGANVDFSTYGLIEFVTGIRSVRTHMARAGSARTPAKIAAARENGKKGGRPRKTEETK